MCKQCTIEKGQSAINWLGNNTYIIIQLCCSWEIYKRISCCCDYTEPGCCLLGLLMRRRKFAFFEQRRCTHMCAKSVLFWLEQNILVKSGSSSCTAAGFGLQAVSDNAVLISTTSLGGILVVVVVVMREVKFPTRQHNDKWITHAFWGKHSIINMWNSIVNCAISSSKLLICHGSTRNKLFFKVVTH